MGLSSPEEVQEEKDQGSPLDKIMEARDEKERIKDVYEQRGKTVPSQRYSFFNPANLYIVQRRDYEILEAMKRCGITSLQDKKILDIGCGSGGELRNFIRYGARPDNLFGIDLLHDRIETAKSISPNIDFKCSSAEALPYDDSSFDIIMQFTVFTSILDNNMQRDIAAEMIRVIKQEGIILWYDYHMNNPRNPDVRGVKKKEIYELFPNCDIQFRRVTLAPPIARALSPYSLLACYLLEKIPFLKTHYLGIIKKTVNG